MVMAVLRVLGGPAPHPHKYLDSLRTSSELQPGSHHFGQPKPQGDVTRTLEAPKMPPVALARPTWRSFWEGGRRAHDEKCSAKGPRVPSFRNSLPSESFF